MEAVIETKNLKAFDKFLLPFRKFKEVFKKAKTYGKIGLLSQCILPGTGPLVLGQVELGLLFIALIYGLATGYGFIAAIYFRKTLEVTAFTFVVVSVIFLMAIIALLYITFNKSVQLVEKLNNDEPVFNFFIFKVVSRFIFSIIDWWKEFILQLKAGDKKVKTLLPLSFFSLGIPLMVFGEFVKGVALLAVQLIGIFFMIARGFSDLTTFFTLHIKGRDEAREALVFGVVALVILLLLLYFYIISIRQTLKAAKNYNERRLGSNFKKQLYDVVDKNFYITSLIVPVVGAIVFTIIPLLFMILSAFTNFTQKTTPGYPSMKTDKFLEWAGFSSFERMFANSANLADLLSVFAWTMIWALLATFTCFFGGLLLAMLINKKSIKCKPLFRSIFVVSMAMPQFVSLLVMHSFFDNYGPLQNVLAQIGLVNGSVPMDLWKNEFSSRMLIIFINMWVGIPYYMLLMSGLLINIPKGYYEAAKIAGASRWQQFKRITFPNIMFMTAPMLITSFVSNINNFNVIWFLTGGGPASESAAGTAGKTDILITWLYKITMTGYKDYNFGAAIGIIMFIITATLSLVVFHRSSSYKNEEEYR